MDPDTSWLASLFGQGALDSPQLSGGAYGYQPPPAPNLLPFVQPGNPQTPPMPVPSVAPTAPSGAPVENPPAMPPAVAPAAPTGMAGLMNQATPDQNKIMAAIRGLKAPEAPVAQKVATPHIYAPHPIQVQPLLHTLMALGITPTQLPQLGRL